MISANFKRPVRIEFLYILSQESEDDEDGEECSEEKADEEEEDDDDDDVVIPNLSDIMATLTKPQVGDP